MATYAIGDIQGCFRTLHRLLERIRYDPGEDRLWLLGGCIQHEELSADDVWTSTDGSRWKKMRTKLPGGGRSHHHAAILKGRLWVLSGRSADSSGFSDSWALAIR